MRRPTVPNIAGLNLRDALSFYPRSRPRALMPEPKHGQDAAEASPDSDWWAGDDEHVNFEQSYQGTRIDVPLAREACPPTACILSLLHACCRSLESFHSSWLHDLHMTLHMFMASFPPIDARLSLHVLHYLTNTHLLWLLARITHLLQESYRIERQALCLFCLCKSNNPGAALGDSALFFLFLPEPA